MIPIKFMKALGTTYGEFTRTEETNAFVAFEKFGHTFVVHEEIESTAMDSFIAYEISELSTGFCINFDTPALSAQEAIDRAWKFLEKRGEHEVKRVIETAKSRIILDTFPSPTGMQKQGGPSGSESSPPL